MISLDTPPTTYPVTLDPRIQELMELAKKINDYKEANKLSWSALKLALPDFGSDKTLTLLLAGKTEGLDIEKWLESYNICSSQIDMLNGEKPAEDDVAENEKANGKLLPNLSLCLKLREMFLRLYRVTDNNRGGAILMEGGGGKTSAARSLQKKWGGRVRRLECLAIWDDAPSAMLFDIAELLGVKEENIPASKHGRYRLVKRKLKEKRRCLILDEAHYMGPKTLSTMVNLINETPGEFIMLGKPLLWRNLERHAYDACNQITVNRLDEMASYDQLPMDDYLNLLKDRLPKLPDLQTAAQMLCTAASDRGHMAFARDVINKAWQLAGTKYVTHANLKEACKFVAKKLGKATPED